MNLGFDSMLRNMPIPPILIFSFVSKYVCSFWSRFSTPFRSRECRSIEGTDFVSVHPFWTLGYYNRTHGQNRTDGQLRANEKRKLKSITKRMNGMGIQYRRGLNQVRPEDSIFQIFWSFITIILFYSRLGFRFTSLTRWTSPKIWARNREPWTCLELPVRVLDLTIQN